MVFITRCVLASSRGVIPRDQQREEEEEEEACRVCGLHRYRHVAMEMVRRSHGYLAVPVMS